MSRIALCILLIVTTLPTHAYVGPGAGLGMLGSVVAVASLVLVAVIGLLVLPVRIALRRLRKPPEKPPEQTDA